MPRTLLVTAALAAPLLLPAVAQALPAGVTDTRFAAGGALSLSAREGNAFAGAVRILPGARILAGGAADGRALVVRTRASGVLDRAFGRAGRVQVRVPDALVSEPVRGLETFRDGRILAGATTAGAGGEPGFMLVFRLLPEGELDPSFGADGLAQVGAPGSRLTAIALDAATGNLLLAGARPVTVGGEDEVPVLVRLLADGTPDPTFGTDGVVDGATLGLRGRAAGVVFTADGGAAFGLGVAPAATGSGTLAAVKLTVAGALDPAYGGGDGIATTVAPASVGLGLGATAVHAGPGGSLVVAGTDASASGTARVEVARFTATGELDPAFGPTQAGTARIARRNVSLRPLALTRGPNGELLLAGTANAPRGFVAALRADGSRARSFGRSGLDFTTLGRPVGGGARTYTQPSAIAIRGSRIALAGSVAGAGTLVPAADGIHWFGRFSFTLSRLR